MTSDNPPRAQTDRQTSSRPGSTTPTCLEAMLLHPRATATFLNSLKHHIKTKKIHSEQKLRLRAVQTPLQFWYWFAQCLLLHLSMFLHCTTFPCQHQRAAQGSRQRTRADKNESSGKTCFNWLRPTSNLPHGKVNAPAGMKQEWRSPLATTQAGFNSTPANVLNPSRKDLWSCLEQNVLLSQEWWQLWAKNRICTRTSSQSCKQSTPTGKVTPEDSTPSTDFCSSSMSFSHGHALLPVLPGNSNLKQRLKQQMGVVPTFKTAPARDSRTHLTLPSG